MEEQEWIPAGKICTHYHVDLSLIRAIGEYGLIDIDAAENDLLVPASGLTALERIVRLHTELEINLEGIAAITHILERVKGLQDEVTALKYRLRSYEAGA
jgi:hypothetical protein